MTGTGSEHDEPSQYQPDLGCLLDDHVGSAQQINREAAQLALTLVDAELIEIEPYPDLSALHRPPGPVDWTLHGFDPDTLPLFEDWIAAIEARVAAERPSGGYDDGQRRRTPPGASSRTARCG